MPPFGPYHELFGPVSMVGKAKPGDWLEVHTDVVRAGRRVVFCNCFIWANAVRIAQATAQFQVIESAPV